MTFWPIPCGSNYHRLLTQPPVPLHGGVAVHHELRLVLKSTVGAKNVQIRRYGWWPSWWSEPRAPGHYLFCSRAIVPKGLRSSILTEGTEDRRRPPCRLTTVVEEPMLESIGTGKKMKTTVSIVYKKRSPLQNPSCFLFDFP
jgi:hypothetical protein